jgi:hypothetical protein
MTRGEAINERARRGAALVRAKQQYDESKGDPRARCIAGVELANAEWAYNEARRIEKEFSP